MRREGVTSVVLVAINIVFIIGYERTLTRRRIRSRKRRMEGGKRGKEERLRWGGERRCTTSPSALSRTKTWQSVLDGSFFSFCLPFLLCYYTLIFLLITNNTDALTHSSMVCCESCPSWRKIYCHQLQRTFLFILKEGKEHKQQKECFSSPSFLCSLVTSTRSDLKPDPPRVWSLLLLVLSNGGFVFLEVFDVVSTRTWEESLSFLSSLGKGKWSQISR